MQKRWIAQLLPPGDLVTFHELVTIDLVAAAVDRDQ